MITQRDQYVPFIIVITRDLLGMSSVSSTKEYKTLKQLFRLYSKGKNEDADTKTLIRSGKSKMKRQCNCKKKMNKPLRT